MATKPSLPLNHHVVGCTEATSSKEYKQVVYAKFPYNATAIYYLCRNCSRRHTWALDSKLRDK